MNDVTWPAGFVNRMQEMLGDEWPAFLCGFTGEPVQGIRFRNGRTAVSPEEQRRILKSLGADDAIPVPWEETAWTIHAGVRPGRAFWHDMGLYYIQEPSAMSAAPLMEPGGRERILDLCAAPGGKSTQIADRLPEDALLIANEIHPTRSRILSQNIERMGIGRAVVTSESPEGLAGRLPHFFHRILVDAPCSGEGMFRKNPLAVSEWSPDQVRVCADRQDLILDEAVQMLCPGGRIVYSTCTFAPEEDEGTILRFLRRHPDFHVASVSSKNGRTAGRPEWAAEDLTGTEREMLSRTLRLWPHLVKGEGHFEAVLEQDGIREGSGAVREKNSGKPGGELSRTEFRMVRFFLEDLLVPEAAAEILAEPLIRFGDQIYRLPAGAPPTDGIRILRPGLHLGTMRKGRFEPAHALALWLDGKECRNRTNLTADDPALTSWYRGESIHVNGAAGWTLITVDHHPAGWGKRSGMQVKNHLPKGLRHP